MPPCRTLSTIAAPGPFSGIAADCSPRIEPAELRVGHVHAAIAGKPGMIQRVYRLEPELQPHPLVDREILGDRTRPSSDTRAAARRRTAVGKLRSVRVPARGHVLARRRVDPQRCVEPLPDRGVVELGAAGLHLRGVRIIDRPAAHISDVPVQLPASDDLIEPAVRTFDASIRPRPNGSS